jgi:hypothetical protein
MSEIGCHIQLYARTQNSSVNWRLLSGNNREIGRGAEHFADAEACRIAVKNLQVVVDSLHELVRQTEAHRWIWQLRGVDGLVAGSPNGYDRLIRCNRGLEQFRAALPYAEVGNTVMISETRRWGGGQPQ